MTEFNPVNATDLKDDSHTYLIYANPGVGKSYALGFLPGKTLVIDIDGSSSTLKRHPNAKNVYIDKMDSSDIWNQWMGRVTDIVNNPERYEQYDNIAVDNVSELFRSVLSDLGTKGSNDGVPNQGDYQKSDFMLLRSLRALNNIDARIVFTAWETTDQYQAPNGQSFTRAMPDIRDKILNNFLGLVDVAARLVIKQDKDSKEEVRGFVMQPKVDVYAKNRIDGRKGAKVESLVIADEPE